MGTTNRRHQTHHVESVELMKFVTAYEVTRHYGGPEEGGWFYNWYSPINTVSTSESNAEWLVESFKKKYGDRVTGDIYSVLGGVAIAVIMEDKPAENKSTERPHYQ